MSRDICTYVTLILHISNTCLLSPWIVINCRTIHQRTRWQLFEKEFLEVIADLCLFIGHEVINPRAHFFNEDQELAMETKYLGLHEWENQQNRDSSSSVGR